jgi:transcriptional regulator with XRE-family HTH domain
MLDMPEFDAKIFGAWLRQKREVLRLSVTEVAEKSGLSKQYISLLERAPIHLLTNKPTQPALDKVERIARVLEVDPAEAREMAGYSARNGHLEKPQNAAEFAERLREMGFDIQTSFDWELIGPDQLQEIMDMIESNLIAKAKRIKREGAETR